MEYMAQDRISFVASTKRDETPWYAYTTRDLSEIPFKRNFFQQ